jgi:hypothetical protein
MKKVEFGAKRPSTNQVPGIDAWVQGGSPDTCEPKKRFTIDVPLSLHKRVKSQCATQNLVMADVIRDLLEQRFPIQQNAEHGVPS